MIKNPREAQQKYLHEIFDKHAQIYLKPEITE